MIVVFSAYLSNLLFFDHISSIKYLGVFSHHVFDLMNRMSWGLALGILFVGIIGVGLALPAVHALAAVADYFGGRVELPIWLQSIAAIVTLTMALFSGLFALRSLRNVEPAALLR